MINVEDRPVLPPVSQETCLGAHFRALAEAIPERMAITFLDRGEEECGAMTFGELDRRARSLAAFLQERNDRGARAIMLFETGVEILPAFLGCVYAGLVAIPMPAPVSGRIDWYLRRVKSVGADADARFVLTTSATMARLQRIAAVAETLRHLEWVAIDRLPDQPSRWVEEKACPDDVVYLQYTSGSTSDPKGVMITQKGLMCSIHYCGTICRCEAEGIRAVNWLPYCHDMGLINGILVPLAYGMPVYLMSPLAFLQKPIRWLNALHRYRATHSAAPNFALDLAARKTTAEERQGLDLLGCRNICVGGEPVRSATVDRFLEIFESHGLAREALCPGWGLAEATLAVTASVQGPRFFVLDAAELERNRALAGSTSGPTRILASCGQVLTGPWNVGIRIVDPQTHEAVVDGEVGEVWVNGDILAKGYWNRPAETHERFHAVIENETGTQYMRTGDLGFVSGGEFVFTGRLKDLIIVEGRNHYPQDIETTVESSHPSLRSSSSVAFSIEPDSGEPVRVCIVCSLNKGYWLDEQPAGGGEHLPAMGRSDEGRVVSRGELIRAIRLAVAEEHQLRVDTVILVPAGAIPKTTSGKLQRSRCKKVYLEGGLPELGYTRTDACHNRDISSLPSRR